MQPDLDDLANKGLPLVRAVHVGTTGILKRHNSMSSFSDVGHFLS
jgi:hypothetical protein